MHLAPQERKKAGAGSLALFSPEARRGEFQIFQDSRKMLSSGWKEHSPIRYMPS